MAEGPPVAVTPRPSGDPAAEGGLPAPGNGVGRRGRIPGFAGIHAQAILLACLLSGLGALGYVRLNRRIQRQLG